MITCKFCKKNFKLQENGRTGNHQKHLARKHIRLVNNEGQVLQVDDKSFPAVHVFVMFSKHLFENATPQELQQEYIVVKHGDFENVVTHCNQERTKDPGVKYETLHKRLQNSTAETRIERELSQNLLPRLVTNSSNDLQPIIPHYKRNRDGVSLPEMTAIVVDQNPTNFTMEIENNEIDNNVSSPANMTDQQMEIDDEYAFDNGAPLMDLEDEPPSIRVEEDGMTTPRNRPVITIETPPTQPQIMKEKERLRKEKLRKAEEKEEKEFANVSYTESHFHSEFINKIMTPPEIKDFVCLYEGTKKGWTALESKILNTAAEILRKKMSKTVKRNQDSKKEKKNKNMKCNFAHKRRSGY